MTAESDLLVWVAGWQMQCCGAPFSVGSRVVWQLHDVPDREWLRAALGDELASAVTHVEDHHELFTDRMSTSHAVVTRIRAASCEFGPAPDRPRGDPLVPVPDTAAVTDVIDADGSYPEADGLHFNGYLVDLHLT